ncbi:MAG: bile acid:sodium symporter [Pirellulaceae bacterium]|nr:bile acid:sodium symporter [Pirellulaceae bacterium]
MLTFLSRRWFLLSLAAVLLVGILGGRRLEPLAEVTLLRHGIVAAVLFLMALPLEAAAVWRALRFPAAPLLAVAVNFVVVPLLAWGASGTLSPELAPGLLVAATTPCTLASAAVWTRRAGGNDAPALLVTLITNATCFLVTPLWLAAMIGQHVEIDVGDMMRKLGLLVVLPMAVAQSLRASRLVGQWATRAKVGLSVLAQVGILFMVFLGAIGTGIRLFDDQSPALGWVQLAWMVVVVLAVHLLAWGIGFRLAGMWGLSRGDRIAVGFAGSQKTLMVGLQVAMESQVSILPMVAYHVGQLIVDTLIADRLRGGSHQAPPSQPGAAAAPDAR